MSSSWLQNVLSLQLSPSGLSEKEVVQQRATFGSNDLLEAHRSPWMDMAKDTLKDPMIWFLVSIGTIFVFIGQVSDGVTLFVAILPLLLMDGFLHWRTQASLSSLTSHLKTQAKVLRDGREIRIESRDVVPGDLLILSPNDLLVADGFFETANELQVDESALTGESFPLSKEVISLSELQLTHYNESSPRASAMGFAGTRILRGTGQLRVLSIGSATSYGSIVRSITSLTTERTPLQKSIAELVKNLVIGAVGLCLLLAVVRWVQGHGWLDALLSAATLAVAAIPEEFPVVLTFFLGVGVYRLARKKVLVRRAISVENLGRVTQICTDKTGTITEGRLQLTHLETAPHLTEKTLLDLAAAASSSSFDPVDLAIIERAKSSQVLSKNLIRTFPYTEDRRRETGIFQDLTGEWIAAVKGAPETLLALSTLTEQEKIGWRARVSFWASQGHKVLACAQKKLSSLSDPLNEPSSALEFCGLLAFEDPPRPEVLEAMSYCHRHQIGVLMMTGDHPDTAAAIAKDCGLLVASEQVISAEEHPEKFEESWLMKHPDFLKNVAVVARCTPLQKLSIVLSLKKAGELVAVTGDGVNDVPALKAADIGIAMGRRGTQSAKEVSSIILTDDHFGTIVHAIQEGRQLFINLRRSFHYLLLIHLPLVLTAAIIPLLGFPLLYLPIHIVWLELIIHPTALFAFQNSVSLKDEVARPKQSLFDRREALVIGMIGIFFAAAIGLSFGLDTLTEEANHARAKALALLTLWNSILALELTRFRSSSAFIISCFNVLITLFLIQWPVLGIDLHLSPLGMKDWAEVLGILAVAWLFSHFSLRVLHQKHLPGRKRARSI